MWEDELASGRVFAGLEDGRAVGTLGAFSTDLTVPGGAAARVGAMSAVTVLPTHLRRGILSGMMAQSLRQSVELGECASILIPAEWPIYGRFGYGPATEQVNTRIDAVEARLINPLPGTVEFVSAEQWCEETRDSYERVRLATPGAIPRQAWWWRREAGLLEPEGKNLDKEQLFAVYRDESGVVRGDVRYQVKDADKWAGFRPKQSLDGHLLAETPVVRARLLQFLWEQDWIAEVRLEDEPVDDTWRQLLQNPRVVAQHDRADVLWVRLLDVAAALSGRTYEAEGRLVIAVQDRDGYAEGVYALEGGPAGATCVRTDRSPDLTMPVQTLGSLYMGGHSATAQAQVGLIVEERAGALAVADRMFTTVGASPYCATWF
jgi:predicted acetyltransferase